MWKEENDQLKATFKFDNFVQAFAFMTEVAFHAEKQGHHPNWSNVYNTVEFALNTHDAGNKVTDKDRALAEAIDGVYEKFGRVQRTDETVEAGETVQTQQPCILQIL